MKDVSFGRVEEPPSNKSVPVYKVQEPTNLSNLNLSTPSQLTWNRNSVPTDITWGRKTSQTSNSGTPMPVQGECRETNLPDQRHTDHVVNRQLAANFAAEHRRKRQRSHSPIVTLQSHSRDDLDNHKRDRIEIPTFDGNDWPAFKSVFESVASHKRWMPSFKALQLKCSITGAARAALNVVDSSEWTYEQLVEHFELRYGKNQTKVDVMNALDKLSRKQSQSLISWRDEVIPVANSGDLTKKQYRELTHYIFLRGLRTYPQLMHWVSERDTEETLQSCFETAKRYERDFGTPELACTRPVRVAAVGASIVPGAPYDCAQLPSQTE